MKLRAPILVMVAEPQTALEFKVWQAIQGGLDMLILRAKDTDLETIRDTLSNLRTSLGNEFPILVNAGERIPRFAQASGYHLPEAAMRDDVVRHGLEKLGWKLGVEPKVAASKALGVSVHSPEAVREAEKLFPDYLLAGTVFETASHPGQPHCGIEGLQAICQATKVGVVAIGGITPENAAACIKAGAYGVAALSPFKGAGREALAKAYKEAMTSGVR